MSCIIGIIPSCIMLLSEGAGGVVTGSAEAAAISATRPAPRNAEVTNFEVLDIGFSSRPVSVSSVLASHYSRAKTFVTLSPIS